VGNHHWTAAGCTASRGRSGFSMVEVAILTVLLLVAVGGLSGAVLSSVRLSRATEESALAADAARALGARMQAGTFAELFRNYNADPDDDVGGTGPGAAFDVEGLTPRTGDPDGRVGRIVFPSVPTGIGSGEILREDFVDERLGMPRDLNGNGDTLDAMDRDYLVLPARLIVEWTGTSGNRQVELDVLLVP
jgi:type II secretory pathway pseudopilin PulG